MDSCYHPKVCNCVSDPNCSQPHDHECCSETPPNGKPKYGMWVKNGTCNNKTGLCSARARNTNSLNDHVESFTVHSREGFNNEDCDVGAWKRAFWVLLFLIFFLLLCIVLYFTSTKRMR